MALHIRTERSPLTTRVEVRNHGRQPISLLLRLRLEDVYNSRLATEHFPDLLGQLLKRSFSDFIQVILVEARLVKATELIKQLLIIRVRCHERRGLGEMGRRVLRQDLLQQTLVLESNLLEVAELALVGGNWVRLEPSTI